MAAHAEARAQARAICSTCCNLANAVCAPELSMSPLVTRGLLHVRDQTEDEQFRSYNSLHDLVTVVLTSLHTLLIVRISLCKTAWDPL